MQSSETTDAENVRTAIIDSFSENQYPGDPQFVRNPEEGGEAQDFFERLQNKSWQDLLVHLERTDGPELYRYCWVYSMLTPESFYYYLPAFLIVAMDVDRVDCVGSHLIYCLSPSEDMESEYTKSWLRQVKKQLSSQQHAAIQKWARYLIQAFPEDIPVQSLKSWLN